MMLGTHALRLLPVASAMILVGGLVSGAQAQLQTLWQRAGHPDTVIFSPDGRTLANGGNGAELFDALTGDSLRGFVARFNNAQALAFSPDGALLAEGVLTLNQNLNVFDSATGAVVVQRITAHQNGTEALAFSPDGQVLATAGRDGETKFWTVPSFTQIASVPSGRRTFGVAYQPQGNILATIGQHGLALWRTSDYSLITWLTSTLGAGDAVAFSPDGALVAGAFGCGPDQNGNCTDGAVRIWRTDDFSLIHTLITPGPSTGSSIALAFSPDGATLAVGGDAGQYDAELGQGAYYGTLRLWDYAAEAITLELRQDIGDGSSAVLSVAYSPDGRLLAYSRYDALLTVALNSAPPPGCSADFDNDGDIGTDQDIEAFFACLAGTCCASCGSADFNGDGDVGTDQDIEAFFRVLAGGSC